MDIKKNIPAIVLILIFTAIIVLVVSFSGCGAKQCPVVVDQTHGIVFSRFAPSYNLIPVGDEVLLTAEVQNKGMSAAKNAKAYVWSNPGFAVTSSNNIELKTLYPPRLDICSAGDSIPLQWRLKAGCDPRESVLAIAVEYDYTGEGWASIYLVSDNEAAKTGGKLSGKGENNPSAGPVQVLLEPLQNEPVIISTDIDSQHNFDVRVKFKNLGTGVAGAEGNGNLTSVNITTVGPCTFTLANKEAYVTSRKLMFDKAHSSEISLSAGSQEAFKILKLQYYGHLGTFTKDFCRINVHAEYHYRDLESTTSKMGITGTASQVQECRDAFASGGGGGGGNIMTCKDEEGTCKAENVCERQGGTSLGSGYSDCLDNEICCYFG